MGFHLHVHKVSTGPRGLGSEGSHRGAEWVALGDLTGGKVGVLGVSQGRGVGGLVGVFTGVEWVTWVSHREVEWVV